MDGDLDHLRVASAAAAPEGLLDELRRHCNSAIIWAPRAIEKEAREIGLQGQDLMRDVHDAFAPELVPEYVERAEALQERIAQLLAAPITF